MELRYRNTHVIGTWMWDIVAAANEHNALQWGDAKTNDDIEPQRIVIRTMKE